MIGPLQNGVRETCPSHRGLSPGIKMIKSPKKKEPRLAFSVPFVLSSALPWVNYTFSVIPVGGFQKWSITLVFLFILSIFLDFVFLPWMSTLRSYCHCLSGLSVFIVNSSHFG